MKVETQTFDWSQEEKQAFYTALDYMDTVLVQAGLDSEIYIAHYMEQKRSGLEEPYKVLNRMASASQRWESLNKSRKGI